MNVLNLIGRISAKPGDAIVLVEVNGILHDIKSVRLPYGLDGPIIVVETQFAYGEQVGGDAA